MVCDRCGSEIEGEPLHTSCFSFILSDTLEKSKANGVNDPILCDECLRLFMHIYDVGYLTPPHELP